MASNRSTFQTLILSLQTFWAERGCVILQPYDVEVGAGTFHPATTLRALGPDPWRCAYVQPSRRPTDGRYGENPNRLQHYYQFQVLLKPSPADSQDLYLQSLYHLGIDPAVHDIRFVEDDWESPTLGAWGLGWEVWCDGMEVTQFTYFQQVGGIECAPVAVELTYGLERLAMYIQGVENVYDLDWDGCGTTYGDVFKRNEVEGSAYNFEYANTEHLFRHFADAEAECKALLALPKPLVLPAYDQCIKASHRFNLLDARGVIGVTERAAYIGRVRALAKGCCEAWLASTGHASEPERGLMPELLLELLSEEIPARMQARAAEDLKRLVCERLDKAQLTYTAPSLRHAAPPGAGGGWPAGAPAGRREERKGPRVGAPQRRSQVSLRAAGLAGIDRGRSCATTEQGQFYLCRTLITGRGDILDRRAGRQSSMRADAIAGLPVAEVDALGRRRRSAGFGRCRASSASSTTSSVPVHVCDLHAACEPAARSTANNEDHRPPLPRASTGSRFATSPTTGTSCGRRR